MHRDDRQRDDLEATRATLTAAVASTCPRWMTNQVEDIVQSAMVRIAQATRDAKSPGPTYLRKVAYSIIVDEMRRRYRRPEVAAGDGPVLDASPSREADPERRAMSEELDRGITDCLQGLVDRRRRAVTLHLQGYTYREAAGLLGWTTKKTEHLAARGIRELRACLETKGLRP
jgi:RNA polymerase sigma-70 factor (ECF subfamily)